MTNKKIEEILIEIYTSLYKAATPSTDFKKLMEDAPTNEDGQKVIDFNSYELDDDMMIKIIKKSMMKNKVPKHLRKRFETTVILGCSPKSKY
jgi:hypothetical protein